MKSIKKIDIRSEGVVGRNVYIFISMSIVRILQAV